MTDKQHPITPPPKLMQQWWDGTHGALYEFEAVVTQAARWGADQELEACCEWLGGWLGTPAVPLRAARRPKPPRLAEEALEALEQIDGWAVSNMNHLSIHDDLVTGVEAIRTALERLKELEKGNG